MSKSEDETARLPTTHLIFDFGSVSDGPVAPNIGSRRAQIVECFTFTYRSPSTSRGRLDFNFDKNPVVTTISLHDPTRMGQLLKAATREHENVSDNQN